MTDDQARQAAVFILDHLFGEPLKDVTSKINSHIIEITMDRYAGNCTHAARHLKISRTVLVMRRKKHRQIPTEGQIQ